MKLKRNKDFLKLENSDIEVREEVFLIENIRQDFALLANVQNCTFFIKNVRLQFIKGHGTFSNNTILDLNDINKEDIRNHTKNSNLYMSDIEEIEQALTEVQNEQ